MLLELAVLLVTARRFVTHILLQQEGEEAQLIITTSQIPLGNKEIGHIATSQDIRLAIVLAVLTNKTIQEPVVQVVTAQTIALGGTLEQDIRHIAISLDGLAVML